MSEKHHEQCPWAFADVGRRWSVCGCPPGWPKPMSDEGRGLAGRIKKWRETDRAGYDEAIELLCEAEDALLEEQRKTRIALNMATKAADQVAAARAEGEAAGRAAERGGVSEDSSEDFDWVRRQIAGALKSAIDAHGPIGMELIGSAAKRITRTVWREFVRRVRAARADERAGVCAILIERQRQHAETEAYHRAEGDLGLARRNQLLAQECGVLLDLFARARAVGGGQ
jgi:hypothetical protein